MDDYFDMSHVRAFVYLNTENDDKNKVLISNDQICIIFKQQKRILSLNVIRELKTVQKKLLLPLILGGIITPFAFLSYFVNLFQPWAHLISVLLGMLLFYIGWNGRPAFILVFKNGDELMHYLPSLSKNLVAFINYVNDYLRARLSFSGSDSIIVTCDRQQESILFGETSEQQASFFPLLGYAPGQFEKFSDKTSTQLVFAFDPHTAGREIRFEFDPAIREMRPMIDGPIKRSSVIKQDSE